jgi:hypothetical protein
MAVSSNVSYPTLVPTSPVGAGAGLPPLRKALPWQNQRSDQSITGALQINPAFAPSMIEGRYAIQTPQNNRLNQPLETKNKVASQTQAGMQGPTAWDKRTLPAMSNAVLFGYRARPQKTIAKPWVKKFIPPLALFNDASQWVNILMFNRPMQKSGNGNSDPDMTGIYPGSYRTPPIETENFAAGALNAQLQLGTLAIQAQQLTISASNYFGGS